MHKAELKIMKGDVKKCFFTSPVFFVSKIRVRWNERIHKKHLISLALLASFPSRESKGVSLSFLTFPISTAKKYSKHNKENKHNSRIEPYIFGSGREAYSAKCTYGGDYYGIFIF